MEDKAYSRYKWVIRQLEEDGEYLYLMERLGQATPEFLAAMESLTPEHRQNVTEYLGLLAELQDRSVQIACMAP